jgi:hypothetical protein
MNLLGNERRNDKFEIFGLVNWRTHGILNYFLFSGKKN